MYEARGYRYGIMVFGFATICSLIAVMVGSYCCSSFPEDYLSTGANPGLDQPRNLMSVSQLMNHSMGFRLCVMTLTASSVGLSAAYLNLIMTMKGVFENSRSALAFRALLAALVVGVFDILAVYVFGFFGYRGPLVLVSFLGIAVLVSLMNIPARSGCILAVPLAIVGFGAAATISMTMGIGWD